MKLSPKQIVDALKYDPHLSAQYNAIMHILDEEISDSLKAAIMPDIIPDARSFNAGRAAALEDFRSEIVSMLTFEE